MITGISLVMCCQLRALQFLSLSLVIYAPSCKYAENISWNIYKQYFILYNHFWFLCDCFGSYNNSVVILMDTDTSQSFLQEYPGKQYCYKDMH